MDNPADTLEKEWVSCGAFDAGMSFKTWLAFELSETRKAMEWRPIETAPKNESVLVVSDYGNIWMAEYKYIGPRAGSRWESVGLGAIRFHPTHWMPLPLPPCRPTPHAGDGDTPIGTSGHSLSGTSQAEPGFNNTPRA